MKMFTPNDCPSLLSHPEEAASDSTIKRAELPLLQKLTQLLPRSEGRRIYLQETHVFVVGTLLLTSVLANLFLIPIALFGGGANPPSENPRRRRPGIIGLSLAAGTEILYFAWWTAGAWGWTRYHHGNPLLLWIMLLGFILSVGACLVSLLGIGLKRCVGVFAGITSGLMWMLSAAAFVAV